MSLVDRAGRRDRARAGCRTASVPTSTRRSSRSRRCCPAPRRRSSRPRSRSALEDQLIGIEGDQAHHLGRAASRSRRSPSSSSSTATSTSPRTTCATASRARAASCREDDRGAGRRQAQTPTRAPIMWIALYGGELARRSSSRPSPRRRSQRPAREAARASPRCCIAGEQPLLDARSGSTTTRLTGAAR